jgi:hypothetical protein
VTFAGATVTTLQPGVYNFDTLNIAAGSSLVIPSTGAVVINIFNASKSSTPLNQNGGTVANTGGDPNNLTFVYNGSNTINLNNGANMFATIYAPHANVVVGGNAGLYGAIVGNTFSFNGSGHVIYDIHLKLATPNVTTPSGGTSYTAHIDGFSWSAY